MPRIAPKGGYDFSKKRDYRRKVWATFRDRIKESGNSVARSHALLMPSLEGDEIEVALNAGFREENLHIVDWEPAIVATLKRRYPKIHTYGVSVTRAFKRLAAEGIRLTCANLDFCGPISRPFAHELLAVSMLGSYRGRIDESARVNGELAIQFEPFRADGVFEDEFWISVSTLRGRETVDCLNGREFSANQMAAHFTNVAARLGFHEEHINRARREWNVGILDAFSERDRQRIMWIWQVLSLSRHDTLPHRPDVSLVRSEFYLSTSGQTMLWSIYNVTSFSSRERLRFAANLKRARLGVAPTRHEEPFIGLEPEWMHNPMQDERLRSLILKKLDASYLD